MKKLIFIIILLIYSDISGQSISVFDIDTTEFPIMRAKFFAFEKNGELIRSISASDFEISENGQPAKATFVSCPAPVPLQPVSSVLTMDVSSSMKNDNRMQLSIGAAKEWINILRPLKSECAITSFDEKNYLIQDFTKDKNNLIESLLKLQPSGGTDYDAGLLNPLAGGLHISAKGSNKKVIIFLTDGKPTKEPKIKDIIEEANTQNCLIYCVVLGMPCPNSLKEISRETGGLWFENIESGEELRNLYSLILMTIQNIEPCTIEWESNIACQFEIRDLRIHIPSLGLTSYTNYFTPEKAVSKLKFEPPYIRFEYPTPGTLVEQNVTVTAINSNIIITDITGNNPSYQITPNAFSLNDGQSQELTVIYNPPDSGYTVCTFTLENETCIEKFNAISGWKGKKAKVPTLHLTHPNGGESFVVESDTIITWEGVAERDTVKLEYSTDAGESWRIITNKATGLKYKWKTIKRPTGNEYLIRASHVSGITAPYIIWEKSLGGIYDDKAYSVTETIDGGFVTGGTSKSWDTVGLCVNGYDNWIVKLNKDGDTLWNKSVGGRGNENIYSVSKTRDGGCIVAGETNTRWWIGHIPHGGYDYWIMKIDDFGQTEWSKLFGGRESDIPSSVIQTADGGFIVAGSSGSYDGDIIGKTEMRYYDYWILRLDYSGEILWQKSFGGDGDDIAQCIIETKDGGFAIAGKSNSKDGNVSGNHGDHDFWVVKLDQSGELLWEKSFGGSSVDYAYSITEASTGGFLVAGATQSTDGDITRKHGGLDIWIVKINEKGDLIWEKTYGGSMVDEAWSIFEASDGGFVIGGYSKSNDGDLTINHGFSDYWVLKIDIDGELLWENSYGGLFEDYAKSITETRDGGYIVAGYSKSIDGDASTNFGDFDFWIVKLSDDGNIFQQDVSDSTFSIVEPIPLLLDIDMKECFIGEAKDSTVSGFIRNIGDWKFGVDSVYFSGSDAASFTLVSGIPPYELYSGDEKSVEFRFEPVRAGLHQADIYIITQADTLKKTILGEGIEQGIAILQNNIDFGMVEFGSFKDKLQEATISNISRLPIHILNTKHNLPNAKDFSTLSGGGEFTLNPGDTAKLDLRYIPSEGGRTSGTLEFHYKGIGSPAVINLFGESNKCNVNLEAYMTEYISAHKPISVYIDDLYCMPVIIKNVSYDEISLDSVFLKNSIEFSIPPSRLPMKIPALDSAELEVCFSSPISGIKTDTLYIFDNCDIHEIALKIESLPDIYSGDAKCGTKIKLKKYNSSTQVYILESQSTNSILIKYLHKEPGFVKINIYNFLGSKVATIVNEYRSAGIYEESFGGPIVPSGVYFYTLETGSIIKNGKFILVE